MATTNTSSPREDALAKIATVFRMKGYEGASVSSIAKATGLAKASLYHHFPGGKEEMVREVFRHLGEAVHTYVLSPLASEGTPQQRISRWTKGVAKLYSDGEKNCILGSMVLSGGLDVTGALVSGTIDAWIDAVSKVLRDAGFNAKEAKARAEDSLITVQGALVLARGKNDLSVFQRALKRLEKDLLAPAE